MRKEPAVQEEFVRNIGLLSEEDQGRIERSRVAVAGAGGVGGVHLLTLARLGVGRFSIADFDTFEPVNVNRQFGAMASTCGRNGSLLSSAGRCSQPSCTTLRPNRSIIPNGPMGA